MPAAVINCDAVMEMGVDYVIDATQSTAAAGIVGYAFDFGDGATSAAKSAVHRYAQTGDYTIILTVTDAEGNTATAEKQVHVRNRDLLGTVRIRILDENNQPVPLASVYFDLGNPNMVVRKTDANGYVTFTAEVGPHTVGCIIPDNQWLPSKKDILVTAGATADYTMTMVHQPMIEGSFEIQRMTFGEIVAAGIDISKPENQYIVNIVVTLTYGQQLKFQYNPVTQQVYGQTSMTYQGVSYTAYPIAPAGRVGGTGYDPGSSGGSDGWLVGDETIQNLSVAVVEIPVSVSTLKDFFSVKLHIINNASSEFSMLDNLITLNLPDGLTIMDTAVSESSRTVSIPEIPGQTTTTINWILRGDKIGTYWLTADYVGKLAQFNETIATQFVAKDPVQVLGMEGLTCHIDAANEISSDNIYYNVTLSNDSGREVYMPGIDVGDVILFIPGESVSLENVLRKTVITDAQGVKTVIDEMPQVLLPGESITRYYYAVLPPPYCDEHWVLLNSQYSVGEDLTFDPFKGYNALGETYGLNVDLTPRPVPFFFDDGVTVTGKIKSNDPGTVTTVKLMQGNEVKYTTTIEKTSGYGQAEQTFTFADVAPGTYSLVIAKPGCTSFTVLNVIIGTDDVNLADDPRFANQTVTLLCGDINGDGMINDSDLAVLWSAANYNKSVKDAANPECDLNGDGMINDSDLAILWSASNYNKGPVVM